MRNGIRRVLLTALSTVLIVTFSTLEIAPLHVSATTVSGDSTDTSGTSSGSTNYSGIYSSSEYVKPGNSWLTPVAKHGELVIVALPIVNMTPYNIKDVVITPVISGKTADYPFEITQSN